MLTDQIQHALSLLFWFFGGVAVVVVVVFSNDVVDAVAVIKSLVPLPEWAAEIYVD